MSTLQHILSTQPLLQVEADYYGIRDLMFHESSIPSFQRADSVFIQSDSGRYDSRVTQLDDGYVPT